MKPLLGNKYFKVGIIAFFVLLFTGILWWKFASDNHIVTYRFAIARDPLWPQLNLRDKRISMTTFTNELMLYVARDQGVKFNFVHADSLTILPDLKDGDYDFMMIPGDPGRYYPGTYEISEPIYRTGPVLVVRIDDELESFSKHSGNILGVPRGSSKAIQEAMRLPNVQIKPYDHMETALDDLVKNKIDAVYVDAITAYTSALGSLKGKIKIAGGPLTKDAIYLIALKNPRNRYFVDKFNQGLKNAHETGIYRSLLDKWKLPNTGNHDQ